MRRWLAIGLVWTAGCASEGDQPGAPGGGGVDTGRDLAPEDCANGIDDDGDGQLDCADASCRGDAACAEDCANGDDDDLDGLTDCADSDCADDAACAEDCTNGADDDLDGQTDCADDDCLGELACLEDCGNGADDDVDGWTDCADDDCVDDPLCAEDCTNDADDDLDGQVDCADQDCWGDPVCDEQCDNGLDDDFDGLIDCDDDECVGVDACVEDCADGDDNDADGDVDCDDVDCAVDASCVELDCDDGADSDGDALFDCDDDDCDFDPICNPSCGYTDLGDATGDGLAVGTNVGATDDWTGSCGSVGGLDVAFWWEVPSDGCYDLDTSEADYDTVLRLYASCGGGELACDDDTTGLQSALTDLELSAGDGYYVIVDAYAASRTGTFQLDVERTGDTCEEFDCTDGLDDDGDGDVDCDDDDCALATDCYEYNCTDGVDNDADGSIDCDDADCARDVTCYEADCTDGLDGDSDGDVDCDDADCASELACSCPADDLVDVVGDAVATGTNVGGVDAFEGSCTYGSGGADATLGWKAPADGCYAIDTSDSDYDTVLFVLDDCVGAELECNDDAGSGLQSALSLDANAGDSFVLVVDAYGSGSTGNWVLDINWDSTGLFCTELDCADGADDDGDGDTDCDDDDCVGDVACP